MSTAPHNVGHGHAMHLLVRQDSKSLIFLFTIVLGGCPLYLLMHNYVAFVLMSLCSLSDRVKIHKIQLKGSG